MKKLQFSKEAEQVNCPFGTIGEFEDYLRRLRDWCRRINNLIAEVDGEAHADKLRDWWSTYYDNYSAYMAVSKLNAAIYGLDAVLSHTCDDMHEGIIGAYTTEWAFWARVIYQGLESLSKSEISDEVARRSGKWIGQLPLPEGMDWKLTQDTMLKDMMPIFVNGYFSEEMSCGEALAVAREWSRHFDPVQPTYLIVVLKDDAILGILSIDDNGMVVRVNYSLPEIRVGNVAVSAPQWNLQNLFNRMSETEED